jgi:hypothetical protein
MSHRPYPNTDRARNQLARHVHQQPATRLVVSPTAVRIAEQFTAFRDYWQTAVGEMAASLAATSRDDYTPRA